MNKLENKLSSREVADMMEVRHSHLLDKIDGINEDLVTENSATEKYWTEGSFTYQGRNFREFMVTKRGCEFLAHKTTGTKGNLFTDRYMDKFAEMEQFIEAEQRKVLTPMEILEQHFKITKEQAQKIEAVDNKVTKLEKDMPLFNIDCKELQAEVRKMGIKVLGGKKSSAYKDNSLRGKVYSDIQSQLKREFGVNKYEAIKRSQLDKAIEIVSRYKAPIVLIDEIEISNNQMVFEEVI